ncbi:MAG: 16S rRNA (guanine(527)-N(7))-methyltransferase RsmG [Acidobacteriota bacterium]|nr:16S rRNA (guanine(527)-N(7))-methyltransferase RsmG [Acidobacteriota bacterium]
MTTFAVLLRKHADLCKQLGMTEKSVSILTSYTERLWAENQKINLVSRKLTPESLVTDHLFDCLIGLPYIPSVNAIADLGAGGGLPAVPLAVCRPQTNLVLYEKSPLKCRFLEGLKDLAPNIKVAGPLDDKGVSGEIDLVIARGFKPIKVILQMTRTYHRDGGRYLLYKGRMARIREELAEAKLKPEKVTIHRLQPVGDAEERHLVCIGNAE